MARIRELSTGWTEKRRPELGTPPARGIWEVTISAGRDRKTGRWRQVSKRVHGGIRAAQAEASAMELEVRSGRVSGRSKTLGQVLDEYIAHREAQGRATKTVEGYRSLAVAVKLELGAVKIRALSARDLDDFYRKLVVTEKLAPRTVRHYHALISQVCNQAIRWRDLDPPNPAGSASPPSIEDEEPEPPDPDEVRAFIAAVLKDDPDLAALIFVAATTGCRRGEICGWRWSDLETGYGQLVVRRSISDPIGVDVEVKGTKTGRRRRMALDEATAAVLLDQWGRYVERCKIGEHEWSRDAYVFSQAEDHSEPWRPSRVTQTVRRARIKAGVSDSMKLQLIRHFTATQLLAAGVDIKTASARMGHDGVVMLRRYASVVPARDEAAAALLGRAIAALPAVVPE